MKESYSCCLKKQNKCIMGCYEVYRPTAQHVQWFCLFPLTYLRLWVTLDPSDLVKTNELMSGQSRCDAWQFDL